jgi:hypothetical protein
MVPIAIKVVANQSSVRCEQRFNTGAFDLDGDVNHCKSALLTLKTAFIATGVISLYEPA